jgi:hypothetical protein
VTNLYFFHLHACYSIFQNFFCAGIQFFVVLNSYKYLFYEIINGKKQPTSWVLYGKGEYNLLSNNCMHKSAYYLSLCSIKKNNSEFKYRLKQARKYPSPNDAYRVMIFGIDPMNKVSIGTLVVKSR